ncbi:hypothetical protein HDU81_010048 [Chytriomyces hyalinus]|nr:hypothetical protein HDU81_010048 [Chytriomyces hyalinus]
MPIRNVNPATDAAAIAAIYAPFIADTIITFEEVPVSAVEMQKRIEAIVASPLNYPYIVYENDDGKVIGYAYGSQFRVRNAYRFTVETSLYLDINEQGKGVGSLLYKELLKRLKDGGFHSALGVVSLPNEASQRLHEKFGFTKCCHLRESGFKFGKWIDVGMWELLLQDS